MPTYQFKCLKCDHEFSEILSVSEYEKRSRKGFRCPKCQSRRLEQELGVHLKTSKKS